MDIVSSNFLPGDPRLIDQIVYELKSQGIFDQFRKECIADVDTKPAYQNLSQRVEGSVMNFLNQQKFAEDLNKNQLREQLRKNISESGFLDSGVERIVDQVVNPKINTVFLPKVEDVVYRFLGIKRPNQEGQRPELKPNVEDLLPNDLEAVSPESVHDQSVANLSVEKKEENVEEANDNSLNSSNTKTEDESPPFEPLEENTKFSAHEEENSVDSHLSGFSGLASRDSMQSTEMQVSIQMDISQDVSQTSVNSEGNLSVITSEEDIKMEICDDAIIPETGDKAETITDAKEVNNQVEIKTDSNTISNLDFKDVVAEKTEVSNDLKETSVEVDINSKKTDEKKRNSTKSDSKRSHDKHKSSRSDKDKKDDKGKRSRSKSESKSKDKLSSRHSSSSKDKDKKEYTNGKDSHSSKKDDKDKDRSRDKSSSKSKDKEKSDKKSEKAKEKSDKDQERSDKDKASKDKERLSKEKARDKDKSDKTKSDKDKHERDRSSSSKYSKEKSSSSSKKDSKEKDVNEDKTLKDKSSSKDKTSSSSKSSSSKSSKDKDKSSSSSSKDKDKKGGGDSKSKLKKSDKDKSSSHDKSSSSSKKDKEKKVADDHYSLKDKKNDRRSTDRDSNDGSGKTSKNSSFAENYSGSIKGSSKESSEVFSSGGGESSNSDSVDKAVEDQKEVGVVELPNVDVASPIKYMKPKFASNIHEAMRIMKIRKQLAKLERQNQLALTNVPVVAESIVDVKVQQNLTGSKEKVKPAKKIKLFLEEEQAKAQKEATAKTNHKPISSPKNNGKNINTIDTFDDTPILKSQDLSMESFEQLEARLAQEMSNINDHMYGDEDDNYEYSSITISPIKTQKPLEQPKILENKILFKALTLPSLARKEISSDSEDDIQLVVDEDVVITEEKLAANVAQEKSIQKDAGHLTNTAAHIDLDEFKGFTVLDRKNTTSKQIEQEIKKIKQYIDKKEKELHRNKILKKQPKILQKQNKFYNPSSPMKFEIKDLLQKNGKILFIKIDKLKIELTPKVLVTLQDMDVGGVVQDTTNINGLTQTVKTAICVPNGHANKQQLSIAGYIAEKPKSEESFVIKWEDEDAPCYYFNKADTISNIHMGILNEHIAKLKKSIEEQSLNIQNNIPKPMKQNFKRKLQGSENNNSISYNDYKSDVSAADQSFNLPLSPAESDKSGEHKKEEPLTVKPKRTGRTLTNKRYSTEDLYKPRPILSGSSTRRRSGRVDDSRP